MQRPLALALILALVCFALVDGCASNACSNACALIVHREVQCQVLVTPDEQAEIDYCSGQLGKLTDASCVFLGDKIFRESCDQVAADVCPGEIQLKWGAACRPT